MMYHEIRALRDRIHELESLLEISDRKADILTNLLKEANAEFERALELVTRSETNFRAVFENAPEAIYIVDTDTHQILDCNPFIVKWLGYSREELLSMRIDDITAADSQDIRNNIRKAVAHGIVRVQERRYLKRDGSVLGAEVTGTMVEYQGKKCLAILVRDVSERKQLEEYSRYKELFENVSDPVFINDFYGPFLEVNEGACGLLGYSREQLLEMKLQEIVGADELEMLSEHGAQVRAGETVQFEMKLMTKEGKFIPFEFHTRPVLYKGTSAVLSVARDLSLRKRLEETLIRTERLTAVGEMASGVAHNFNNLLQMIMGSAQAALTKLESGKISHGAEAVKAILLSCERGADVVRRIKEFTQVSAEDHDNGRTFDLSELVREAVELTKPLWRDPPSFRKYEVQLDIRKGCCVKGKPSEIYEVLVNLIRNALEAMPHGGTLSISTGADSLYVYFRVADTGHGIPRETLQKIFEPFFTTKGLRSSGLGLSSSYGIVKKHQGEIQVESTQDLGTAFTVILPKAERMRTSAGDKENVPVLDHKIRFLVIDDEVNILKAMKMFFEDSDVEIVSALSGREGLEKFHTGIFDAVLCDLGMDDVNGWEVGQSIKTYCDGKGLQKPVFLIYTGWDKKIEPRELEERGVDRVVTKPIPYDALLQIVCEEVAKRRTNPTGMSDSRRFSV